MDKKLAKEEKRRLLKEKKELINELRKDFDGLDDYQKKLLCLRKIIDISGYIYDANDLLYSYEEVSNLIKASDFSINTFESYMLQVSCMLINNNKKIYQDVLKDYRNILRNYFYLSYELRLKTPLELSIFLTYLLWNGYFSLNNNHTYKLRDRKLINGLFSFDVINGGGVCLSYANLLKDFLLTANIDSSLLLVKANPKKIQLDSCINIKRNISVSKKELNHLNLISNLPINFGNHAVTLILENEKLYIYDPTTLSLFNIKNLKKASIVNGIGEIDIKPIYSLILSPDSDPKSLFNLLNNDIHYNKLYQKNDFVNIASSVVYKLEQNKQLIIDYYLNNHDSINNIVNFLERKEKSKSLEY